MAQMWIEILEQPEILKRSLENNSKNINFIVKSLKEKNINHVIIAARGTSHHAGIYAKYLMEIKLGIPVSIAAPSVTTLYNKPLNYDGALFIGISQSGRAQDVLEVLKAAKTQGAPTIAITNFDDSPLAKEAEFHLNCSAGEEKSVAATKTFTTQMHLLAWLVAEWAGDEEFKKELSSVPGILKKIIDDSDYIEQLVKRRSFRLNAL